MMKLILSMTVLCLALSVSQADTLLVRSHNNVHVTSHGNYTQKAYFPEGQKYRKVLLHYDLSCPPGGCSAWDYTVVMYVRKKNPDALNPNGSWIELARAITPYGNTYNQSWKHRLTYDVTDYQHLLTDSVEVRYFYDGWSAGWLVSLEFELIQGLPTRDCYNVTLLWQGGMPYGDPNNPIDNYLPERSILLPDSLAAAEVRVYQTGHGFGGSDNCAEFCPKPHYLNVNGVQRYESEVFRYDCGLNALWAQGGTWLYDRANWCPGDLSEAFRYSITPWITPGDSIKVDLNMDPYTNQGNNNSSYRIEGQLLEFGPYRNAHDARVLEIIAPGQADRYQRFNPICGSPIFRLGNGGSDTLKSVQIDYGVIGAAQQSLVWSGALAPGDSTTVTLPPLVWTQLNGTEWDFYVELKDPNHQADAYPDDNRAQSKAVQIPVYPADFEIRFKSNAAPHENSYHIRRPDGQVVFERSGFKVNQYHYDTVHLDPGCYVFEFFDSDKDGLTFFNNNDGSGLLQFRSATNFQHYKTFQANFGTQLYHEFTVSYALGALAEHSLLPELQIWPVPARDQVSVLWEGEPSSYRILNLTGSVLKKGHVAGHGRETILDLSPLPAGVYILELDHQGALLPQRLIKE